MIFLEKEEIKALDLLVFTFKKMSKNVVPELDVCHKFAEEIRREISFDQRSKCIITHYVTCFM